MSVDKFRTALENIVQEQVKGHKKKIRYNQLNEHKLKLLKTRTFEEKVQFFDS